MRIFSIIITGFNPLDQKTHIYSKVYDILLKNENFKGASIRTSLKAFCKNTSPQAVLFPKLNFMMRVDDNIMAFMIASNEGPIVAYAFCDLTYSKKIACLLLKQALKNFESNHLNIYTKYLEDQNLDCHLTDLLMYYQFPIDFDEFGLYANIIKKDLLEASSSSSLIIQKANYAQQLSAFIKRAIQIKQ